MYLVYPPHPSHPSNPRLISNWIEGKSIVVLTGWEFKCSRRKIFVVKVTLSNKSEDANDMIIQFILGTVPETIPNIKLVIYFFVLDEFYIQLLQYYNIKAKRVYGKKKVYGKVRKKKWDGFWTTSRSDFADSGLMVSIGDRKQLDISKISRNNPTRCLLQPTTKGRESSIQLVVS